jgi:glutamate-1-semialdehyde 2,1-aminomutase
VEEWPVTTVGAGRGSKLASTSDELLHRASKVIPGGVNSGRRSPASKVCIAHARGARLWDAAGRELIDYHAAFGPILLGHAFPEVDDAVARAARSGALVGLGVTDEECMLGEKIVGHVPSVEQVVFCNSGSEATYHALRLARAVTGRDKLIAFGGTYHGWHDAVRVSAGGLESTRQLTVTCTFNDLPGLQQTLAEHEGEIAAVILEPYIHNAAGVSIAPLPGFLDGVRAACDRHGVVLICDEVITGFRHALGGYQSIVGLRPDLTVMAKALANGWPLAAVGGRAELMERFSTHPAGDVVMGGTYNGGRASVAAALATITVLEREAVHQHIFELGQRMRDGLQALIERTGVEAQVGGFGSLFVLSFLTGDVRDHRDADRADAELFLEYRRQLIARGIMEIAENVGRSHISYSHTSADIDISLERAEDALRAALDASVRRS